MKFFKSVGSLAVIIAMLILGIIYQIIHVDSQNIPSLGALYYMYKKYPNMKLQHCIEAANQCRMFSSCKGIYLHLPTGECLFDNSTVKVKDLNSTTTTELKSLTTTKPLLTSIANTSSTMEATTVTTMEATTTELVSSLSLTATESLLTSKANTSSTMEATTVTTMEATTTELVSSLSLTTTESLLTSKANTSSTMEATTVTTMEATTTELVSSLSLTTTESLLTSKANTSSPNNQTMNTIFNDTTSTELVTTTMEATTKLVATLQPFTNYTSIHFKAKSKDHKIYAKSFNTAELSACFWMRQGNSFFFTTAGVLSIFQSPVDNPDYECNDFLILYANKKLVLLRETPAINSGYLYTAKQFDYGESNHVCFRWSTKEFVFYVNGVFDKMYNINHEKLVANHFAVGNDLDENFNKCVVNDAYQSFLGEISGLNIWNRVLNESEIENIYSKGFIPANNLAVVWKDVLNFETTSSIKKKDFVV